MNIKVIEPIGESESAIRSRLKGRLEKRGDQHCLSAIVEDAAIRS